MPVKRSTIIRWTGSGSLRRLSSSVGYVLRAHRLGGRVNIVGESVVVSGPDPLHVAALLGHLPGVVWIAAGFAADGQDEMVRATATLARLRLRSGDRFLVRAEGTGGALASDVGGAAVSRILDAVRGARVSESAKVVFRAAADGKKGVIGVEVSSGPGGVTTGTERASCLVSGGIHSSVVAWMAALAGFNVRLVHAKVSDESLVSVAKLYSELSHRIDPRGLTLEVLEGEPVAGVMANYAAGTDDEVLCGIHAGGQPRGRLMKELASPLFLMPEERFREEFQSLNVRAFQGETSWGRTGPTKFTSRRFAGGPADVSDVIDGLR